METLKNDAGRSILLAMVRAIQTNKSYLGDIDGLIGDGDHGMNMNKGFSLYEEALGDADVRFSDGLFDLGTVLLNKIGGSMGPIYGTIFMEMSDVCDDADEIDLRLFSDMMTAGLEGLYGLVDARTGDKTIVDTLAPAAESLRLSAENGESFSEALDKMIEAAESGKESTKELAARYGRASRLGDRSRGVLDAGATSCCLILQAMAEEIKNNLT